MKTGQTIASPKSKWMKRLKVIAVIVIILFIPYAIVKGVGPLTPKNPPKDFVITHNMFDLNQVVAISRFRSCQGHRSMSQYTTEPNSSMATYIMTNVKESKERKGEIKLYAPFDGYISDTLNNQGVAFLPKSSKFPWWPFNQYKINVAHSEPLPQFKGTKPVKAGELVGHEKIDEHYEDGENISLDVRVGVMAWPPQRVANNGEPLKNMDSMFHHMSDEVFAEYASITPGLKSREEFIVPVEYRAAHPCVLQGKGPYFDYKASQSENSKYGDFLYLRINNDDPNAIGKASCLMGKCSSK